MRVFCLEEIFARARRFGFGEAPYSEGIHSVDYAVSYCRAWNTKQQMTETELKAARAVAFRFLGHSARSGAEIERRLERGGFDTEVTADVVAELRRDGYLDDDRFASDWIHDRADRKRYGKTRLASELTSRGVDRDIVKQAIGEVSEEDEIRRAMEIAAAKAPANPLSIQNHEEMLKAEHRLAQMLQRRGFNWEIVKQVLALRAENRKELS
jgi:regulatory protein